MNSGKDITIRPNTTESVRFCADGTVIMSQEYYGRMRSLAIGWKRLAKKYKDQSEWHKAIKLAHKVLLDDALAEAAEAEGALAGNRFARRLAKEHWHVVDHFRKLQLGHYADRIADLEATNKRIAALEAVAYAARDYVREYGIGQRQGSYMPPLREALIRLAQMDKI